MRERLHPDEEVADNHRRAEVSSIMEGFFLDTLQSAVSGFSCLAPPFRKSTHWPCQTDHDSSVSRFNAKLITAYSRNVLLDSRSRLVEV